MYDYDKLNNGHKGFPEKQTMITCAKQDQEAGKPEKKIMEESMEFAVTMASSYFSQLIRRINQQIAEAIQELGIHDEWVNLGKVAEHAIRVRNLCLKHERNAKLLKDIKALSQLQEKVLTASIPEIKEMFKTEWLKENFPDLF